jgi:hypothetical protein
VETSTRSRLKEKQLEGQTGKLEGGPFSALTLAKSLGTKLGTKQAQHLVEDGHFNALTGLHSVSGRSLDSPSGLAF